MASDSLNLKVIFQMRIHPSQTPEKPQTVPLSILDAITARYTPTQAFWLFNPPPANCPPYSVQGLERSLRHTVDAYPQWTGSLRWSPYKPNGTHTQRYNRLQVQWGYQSDAGVEFIVAESPLSLTSFVPEAQDRHRQLWGPQSFPAKELLSPMKLSLYDQSTWEGLPMVTVQVTKFQGDGGIAIGVKMAHPIADTETMMTFLKDWSAINRV
jgi:hypothetical protein